MSQAMRTSNLCLLAACVTALFAAAQLAPVAEAAKRDAGRRDAGTRTNLSGNRNNNVNINGGHNDVDINVDVDNGWNNGPWDDHWHPVGAAVAVGTTVAVTRAIVGTRVYVLPSTTCTVYPYAGATYYVCGDDWYAPQYVGTQVTYVVVKRPY